MNATIPDEAVRPGRGARSLLARARTFQAAAGDLALAPDTRRRAARHAFEIVRDGLVREHVATMPLDRLQEATSGRLRLGVLADAGITTVGKATAAGRHGLMRVPGVGEQTATKVVAAARQLESAMAQNVRVRFDPDQRPAPQGDLLRALHDYDIAQRAVTPLQGRLEELAPYLDRVVADAELASGRVRMLLAGRNRRATARAALAELERLMQAQTVTDLERDVAGALAAIEHPAPAGAAIWDDYAARAVAYNGLLIEVGEMAPDLDSTQGFIPAEVAARVHEHPLDTSLLTVSLRGYQAFGAKFALAQGRAVLGDEMGLGKTIEALAAMGHLHAEGATHFLVVCPASVLVNWLHEVEGASRLRAHRIHGPERERRRAVEAWVQQGGVAVTTYDSLKSLELPDGVRPAMLIADEAHYVKNPATHRAKAVVRWLGQVERALFLSGTPMENRVDEFKVLIGHLKPDVAARVSAVDGLAGAQAFRTAVAPVYLRRNQKDVLEELPPRIESEEWVELAGEDLHAYRDAVASGNFMAMRRAAYVPGTVVGSAKLARLDEIVREAASNDRKVVVFSYFLDVIDAVTSVVGDLAVGALTGSVAPSMRQALVDEFTARPGPAVLLGQIEAGGVGLNIQAASVVILTEPQWKPTIEDQAIHRCHRMGQIRPVDVHRLLAEHSVDQRMRELLATKSQLFDEYVRRSALKDTSPDAVDVTDATATQGVATQAEAERRIIALERHRLGLEPAPA